ncbi:hypothetical protein [Pedobacter agri]|uniref:Uncharacterized protein n=1 Tax=Pedobacter agri TaxID=454586 RepID=A0A9X3IBV3_9SPHI|nr:hypothetical protein [Pedobacter agri]MCX3266983.1 hypothetical protein [Pedobacter agri]RZJ71154.1 MAG: hypothetical protein EOO47_23065 [Flavobacterium sp.]
MTLAEFRDSLKLDQPKPNLSVPLKALWYDGKGEWNNAHNEVDHLSDISSSRIHAYLHRKEGDIWNADYWYRKAKETRPNVSLEEEWEMLVTRFL